jgi:hypothetical protein|tara:strand:+ start:48072 stop:48398 length:327 start_codon:yes stop_codon:yes gene_type:complete
MRIQEITENYIGELRADAQNLLMSALANGETEISTDSLVKELNQMSYSVTAQSLGDLFKNSKLVKSINPDKIFLNTDNNLTQYSKDATMDNEKKVADMAKKTIDRDLK